MEETFVILLHTGHGAAHHDLMLPHGAALATWQLPADPAGLAAGEELGAVRLADHRPAYLTYEGPVSRGRGTVQRTDRGTCRFVRAADDAWEFFLNGRRCHGRFQLRPIGDEPDQWALARLE